MMSALLLLTWSSCEKYRCTKDAGEKNYKILGWQVKDIWKMKAGQSVRLDTNNMAMGPADSLFFSLYQDTSVLTEVKDAGSSSSENVCLDGGYEFNYISAYDSMQVISLEDFDLNHPAGSDISAFFILTNKINFFSYEWDRFYGPLGRLDEVEKRFSLEKFSVVLTKKPQNQSARFMFRFFKRSGAESAVTYSPRIRFQ